MKHVNDFLFHPDKQGVKPKTSKAYRTALVCVSVAVLALAVGGAALARQAVDLAGATVVTRAGQLPKAEQTAAQVLVEELQKRIGKRLPVVTSWPREGLVVAVTAGPADAARGHPMPNRTGADRPQARPEGYPFIGEGKHGWV